MTREEAIAFFSGLRDVVSSRFYVTAGEKHSLDHDTTEAWKALGVNPEEVKK